MSMINETFADAVGYVYLDGEFYNLYDREANPSLANHSLHYGGLVFEGERAYEGRIFRSEDHSKRLVRSAELAKTPAPGVTVDIIEKAKYDLLEKNGFKNAYLRAFIFRGPGLGVKAGKDIQTHFAVVAKPASVYWPDHILENGLRLHTVDTRKISHHSIKQTSKASANYQASQIASYSAMEMGYDDALMYDPKGKYIVELPVANPFFIKDEVLYTPKTAKDFDKTPFLPGITRDTIINIVAPKLGLTVVEKHIALSDVLHADEAFSVGSATEVTPIAEINNTAYLMNDIPPSDIYNFRRSGPVTHKVMQAYAEHVRSPVVV